MWIPEDASCSEVAEFYRRRFGWPTTAHGHAVWTLAGEAMDAVDVPRDLASAARSALRHNGRPHAVIDVPSEPGYWRFPILPRRRLQHSWVRQLADHGAIYLGHSALIELPPTAVTGGQLRWLTPPSGEFPPLTAMLAAVLRSAHRPGNR